MLYQGIIGGGSSPVKPVDLSPVLLWTNPNPASAFSAQTVELDLTEYAGVIIESNFTTRNATLASRVYYKVGETASGNTVLGMGTHNTEANGCSARSVLVTSTGITFGTPYFGAGVVSETDLIPTKIYGVKEYVVEVQQPFTKDLLWTNQSPTSEFGTFGQTNYVEADLTNYEYVLVEYRKSTTDATTSFFMNKVSELPSTTNGNQNGLGTSGSGYGICRPVSKNSSNKLGFEGAFAGQTPALNACIPVKVYGINGLAV